MDSSSRARQLSWDPFDVPDDARPRIRTGGLCLLNTRFFPAATRYLAWSAQLVEAVPSLGSVYCAEVCEVGVSTALCTLGLW